MERPQPYGNPLSISLGVGIWPSTETMISCSKEWANQFIKLAKNTKLDNLHNKPYCVKSFFYIRKYWRRRNILVEIWVHEVRKPHILKYRDVHGNQTDFALCNSVSCAFGITFSNSLPVVDKRLIGRKLCGNLGSLPAFGKVITSASFREAENVTAESNECKNKMYQRSSWLCHSSGG